MTDRPASSAVAARRRLGSPALHFTLAGILAYAAFGAPAPAPDPGETSRTIVIDAARVRGLRRDYALANRRQASPDEVRVLVDQLVDEEILFRESVARGFEQGDRSIAWRMQQKMNLLDEDAGLEQDEMVERALGMGLHRSDPVVRRILVEKIRLVIARAAAAPTEAELEAWFRDHAAEYRQAGRVTLRHVYFDRGRRGDEGAREAARAAAADAEGHGPERGPTVRGDAFVMGSVLRGQSQGDLAKLFGPAFASEAVTLPSGRWSGPLESTYGWHLVLVEERFDARLPTLDEVRTRATKGYESGVRERRVQEFLAGVRPLYDVRIDEAALAAGDADVFGSAPPGGAAAPTGEAAAKGPAQDGGRASGGTDD